MENKTKVALWKVYISGKWGYERTLGYVIASAIDFDWLLDKRLSIQPWVACDIVRRF